MVKFGRLTNILQTLSTFICKNQNFTFRLTYLHNFKLTIVASSFHEPFLQRLLHQKCLQFDLTLRLSLEIRLRCYNENLVVKLDDVASLPLIQKHVQVYLTTFLG